MSEAAPADRPPVMAKQPAPLRRMTGRDVDGQHRTSTPLERLMDLTFVVAFGIDNVPGAGKPLQLSDDPDWWIKAKIERENLEPALPGPLMLRREVERVQATLADVASEAVARAILADLNDRIRAHYARPSAGPLIEVRLVDVEAELATWRAAG